MNGILTEILRPYQVDWVNDQSRFKIGLWSRQTGKSFATACEAVIGCQLRPGEMWVVLSAGERQALEWMAKAKLWAKAVKLAIDSEETLRGSGAESLMTRTEVKFGNGSRILAIPANPDTARGYSANIILDEFAIHEKPYEIWAAMFPSITNDITGRKVLRIVSTPKGRGNKFADLWEHNTNYSRRKVTILDAARMGLFGKDQKVAAAKVQELKDGVADPEIWAQEFMCEFIDSSAVLLPYDLIGACETTDEADPGDAPLYAGMDIGRSHDLSVIVTAAMVAGTLRIAAVQVLERMPFKEQLKALLTVLENPRVRRCCIDATGIGAMLAEEAKRKCGKAEPVIFNSKTKGEMYAEMKRRFEDRTIRVPVSRWLREDLHAVQKQVSTGGAVTYSAPRAADGHSDRAAALALAIRAAMRHGIVMAPILSAPRAELEDRAI